MTAKVDISLLRFFAERALADSESAWTYVDGPLVGDVHVETRPKNPSRSKIRLDPNAIGPFIAAASPGTVLALLDDVERSRIATAIATAKLGSPEVHLACLQKIDALEERIAAMTCDLTEALDLFDATWCPEHGHAPRPDQFERAKTLRKKLKAEGP